MIGVLKDIRTLTHSERKPVLKKNTGRRWHLRIKEGRLSKS